MLKSEQKESLRQIDKLVNGLIDLLQWNADACGLTFEEAARASCYLAIAKNMQGRLIEAYPNGELYDLSEEDPAK